jgi:hypothetical protein
MGALLITSSKMQIKLKRQIVSIDNAPQVWTATSVWAGKVQDITWTFDDDLRFQHAK